MINPERLDQIAQLATAFRRAIERDVLPLGITFKNFPRGSCGDAALLLGTYLKEEGFGTFAYVLGDWRQGDAWSSHAWIEQEGLVVDITADQFDEISTPIIVAKTSEWHDRLRQETNGEADYRIYDPRTVANLGRMYGLIRSRLDKGAA